MASLILRVKVTPRSKASSLTQAPDGRWVARLRSPPVDGKANEELIGLVAERFRCRKADVRIAAGATARVKTVRIDMP